MKALQNRRGLNIGTAALVVMAGLASTTPLAAQDYPDRPIRALVGFAAGSGGDMLARYFSSKVAELAGKSVVLENKPGATGNIAVGLAAQAKPDGYTLLYSADSNMVGNRFLYKDLTFDTVKDFQPVAQLSQTTFLLVVDTKSSVKTVEELSRQILADPKSKYGYTNQQAQIATEAYKATIGATAVTPVSYRTAADAIADVMSGDISFMIVDGTFGSGQVRAGRVRALAVTTAARHPSMADVPTMQEAGVTDFEFGSWWAVWVPKGTPQPVIDKLSGWYDQITRLDETREFLSKVNGTPQPGGPAVVSERQRQDMAKWERVTKAAGIVPQ